MMKRTVTFLVVAVVAAGATFLLGMRTKSPLVLDAVRRFNRAVMNPRQMASAGTTGAYASVIVHHGRSTGTRYETPVVAEPTDDGFVIALPYGSRADWVKNVLASGSATIVDNGETWVVDRPELVPMATVEHHFPPDDQRTHRLFGVDQCLQVRRVAAEP